MKRIILWCACLILVCLPHPSRAVVEHDTMFVQYAGKDYVAPIPKAYTLKTVISIFGPDSDMFKEPMDVCVASNGHVYVADTGNNRIVEFDGQYRFAAVYDNRAEQGFAGPQGVFVDAAGSIYAADTGHERIVKLSKAGRFVEAFRKPESALLTDSFTFNPRKIAISDVGYLYAIKYQNLMQIDAFGRFRGFIGTNMVAYDFWRQVRLLFSNTEQRKSFQRQQPYSVYSFALSPDGSMYITTPDPEGQLKKINTVGKNIYPKKSFFGQMVATGTGERKIYANPQYIDVAVDASETAILLEGLSGQISVYDSFGDNLACFGGRFEGEAGFILPVALDVTADGEIIVVDQGASCVKVFEPTRFMRTVLQAVSLFSKGRYDEAENSWQAILKSHESYTLANMGMAKAKYKQGDYAAAMAYYQLCDDADGYSQAFTKYRHQVFREHFAPTLALGTGAIALTAVLVWLMLAFIRRHMHRYGHLI